ncbi:MAG: hypothetical protein JNL98_36205 [Bryobacterales bacterium]|nr:hypothetical protein [Bryobacterales bacterium]
MDGNERNESGYEELSASLASDLRGLRRDVAPRREVEARLMSELRLGRTHSRTRRVLPQWMAIAAALAVTYAAGWYSAQRPAATVRPGDRYVLLLYGESQLKDSVEAHRRWAVDLHKRGILIGSTKLKKEAVDMGSPMPSDGSLGGYFVIRADSLDEALGIANQCPHRMGGGRVIVRPVDPV